MSLLDKKVKAFVLPLTKGDDTILMDSDGVYYTLYIKENGDLIAVRRGTPNGPKVPD